MIGKLTIDKASMNISYFLYTLIIIYKNNGIISRKNFVEEMASFVGVSAIKNGKENRTAYNKSKMVRYFGFADVVIKTNNENYLVLTNRGKILLGYIKDNGEQIDAENRYSIIPDCRDKFVDLIFDSVIFDSFGKNNSGAEQSNTDVEPPKVVFKTLLELEMATSDEICHVLYGLNRGVYKSFYEAIENIKKNRNRDYTKLNEAWGIKNIANDCKIIDIFTDSNINLIVEEKDEEDGKKYYKLSSNLDEVHRKQIQQISVIYQPIRLFTYSKGNSDELFKWIYSAVLGRVGEGEQVFNFDWSAISKIKFCTPNGASFTPCVFEQAVLAAYNNERRNVYIVLRNVSEKDFFAEISRYSSLLHYMNEFTSNNHGWSEEKIEDIEFYQYLINNSLNAKNILNKNKVTIPSNLHIVGSIIMNSTEDIKFDYEFQRCFVDTGKSIETKLTPEWFRSHAEEFDEIALEAEIQYDDFQCKFAPEILSTLSGEDLLHKMFYSGDSNKDNLCYYLEFHSKIRELFGSVAGGSAYKFNLFYQKKNSSWMTGSSAKPKKLTLEEAVVLGTEIRDAILNGTEIIKANKGVDVGYYQLYNQLFAMMGRYINLLWVQKYYHLIFPDMFPVFYNETWQRHILTKLGIEPYDNGFVRMGQINSFVKECGIENVIFAQIIYKYLSLDDGVDSNKAEADDELVNTELPTLFTREKKVMPLNSILYGAPGTGKTYATAEYALAIIENRPVDLSKKSLEERKALMEKYKAALKSGRITFTTFHQSYGYEDFVQGLRPTTKNGAMEFVNVDGVFKKIVNNAIHDAQNDYVIIIDEINRANISKVFGELITLIEEDKRWGEVNALSVTLPSGDNFAVPNNLFIVGTMNSADKSISLIDTALRRRFEFIEVVPDSSLINDNVLKLVFERLNKELVKDLDSTDLLIGHAYFIGKEEKDLCDIMNHSITPLLYEYFFDKSTKVENIVKKAIEGYAYEVKSADVGRIKVMAKSSTKV